MLNEKENKAIIDILSMRLPDVIKDNLGMGDAEFFVKNISVSHGKGGDIVVSVKFTLHSVDGRDFFWLFNTPMV